MKLSNLSTIAFLAGTLFNHAVFAASTLVSGAVAKKTISAVAYSHYDANSNFPNDPDADDEKDDSKSSEDNVRDEGCANMQCLLESKTPIVCMNAHDQTIYYSLQGKNSIHILDCQKGYQLKDLIPDEHSYDAQCGEIKAIACGGDVTCLTSSRKEIFYMYKEKEHQIGTPKHDYQYIYATQGKQNNTRYTVMAGQNDFFMYNSCGKRGKEWQGSNLRSDFKHIDYEFSNASNGSITGICCTDDGHRIFLSYENRILFLQCFYTGWWHTYLKHKGVRSLCCTSDGSLLFLASPSEGVKFFSYQKRRRVWDQDKYEYKGSLSKNTSINSLHCTPDDRYLMAGAENGEVNIWEISKGKEPSLLLRKKIENGNIKQVCSIKRNKDSVLIALLEENNKSRIYALASISCEEKEEEEKEEEKQGSISQQEPRQANLELKTVEEIQRLIFQQEAKQAKHELEKVKEEIDCTKWDVKPERKKFKKEKDLRKRWLKAARELDFYALEWLQSDEKVGGSKGVTKYQEDGKTYGEEKGFNALHYAAFYEHLPIVKDIGAPLRNYKEAFHALDSKGRTAMDIAYEKKNYPILLALKSMGGKLEKHKDDSDLTKLKQEIDTQKQSIHSPQTQYNNDI